MMLQVFFICQLTVCVQSSLDRDSTSMTTTLKGKMAQSCPIWLSSNRVKAAEFELFFKKEKENTFFFQFLQNQNGSISLSIYSFLIANFLWGPMIQKVNTVGPLIVTWVMIYNQGQEMNQYCNYSDSHSVIFKLLILLSFSTPGENPLQYQIQPNFKKFDFFSRRQCLGENQKSYPYSQ